MGKFSAYQKRNKQSRKNNNSSNDCVGYCQHYLLFINFTFGRKTNHKHSVAEFATCKFFLFAFEFIGYQFFRSVFFCQFFYNTVKSVVALAYKYSSLEVGVVQNRSVTFKHCCLTGTENRNLFNKIYNMLCENVCTDNANQSFVFINRHNVGYYVTFKVNVIIRFEPRCRFAYGWYVPPINALFFFGRQRCNIG